MRPFDRDKICLNTKNNCPLNSDISSSYNYRVLEIGTGTGMHPLSYAQKFPDRLIIAIEKTHERYGKFIRAYEKTKPMNLIPVHSHAVSWVAHNIGPEELDEIFILYPNPNPKISDLNKRWHAMPFFGYLINTLKPFGKITIRTNELFYAEEARLFMNETWKLNDVEIRPFTLGDVSEFKTLFEKKYLERGQTCYEISGNKKN